MIDAASPCVARLVVDPTSRVAGVRRHCSLIRRRRSARGRQTEEATGVVRHPSPRDGRSGTDAADRDRAGVEARAGALPIWAVGRRGEDPSRCRRRWWWRRRRRRWRWRRRRDGSRRRFARDRCTTRGHAAKIHFRGLVRSISHGDRYSGGKPLAELLAKRVLIAKCDKDDDESDRNDDEDVLEKSLAASGPALLAEKPSHDLTPIPPVSMVDWFIAKSPFWKHIRALSGFDIEMRFRPRCRILNRRTGENLADRAMKAESFVERARGLLGRGSIDRGEGLWIEPCSSIHMFFMHFAIDALFVDRQGKVTKAVSNLRPWRIAFGGRGARAVLELPAGTIAASGTRVGDVLDLDCV